MHTSLVIGAGFGDEGKGRVVSSLASQNPGAIVVRFNGGHQAGHTVWKDRSPDTKRHVFSSFGSGTLHGAPTYWSRYCTLYPWAVRNEFNDLVKKYGIQPTLYVDPLCPITTNFDILHNRNVEKELRHGSCGVGINATITRHEDHHQKLFFQDLYNEVVLQAKLDNIIKYYKIPPSPTLDMMRENFLLGVHFVRNAGHIQMVHPHDMGFNRYNHVIFEGAQGILLDQDFGFFPNVTRGFATSKNAMEFIKQYNLPAPEIYRLSRTYQTRHGNGFMSNEKLVPNLTNTEHETNIEHEWQGQFRRSYLDLDLLRYAIQCDQLFTGPRTSTLVLTCVDQTGTIFPATTKRSHRIDVDLISKPEVLSKELREHHVGDILLSHSRFTEQLVTAFNGDDIY